MGACAWQNEQGSLSLCMWQEGQAPSGVRGRASGLKSGPLGEPADMHRVFWPEHGVFWSEHAMFCPEHVVFWPEHAMFCSKHAMFWPEHATFCSEHAMFWPEHAMFCPKHAMFCSEHAVFCSEHAVFSSEHAVFSPEHAVFWRVHRLRLERIGRDAGVKPGPDPRHEELLAVRGRAEASYRHAQLAQVRLADPRRTGRDGWVGEARGGERL
jgi:hypothetical protein